MKKVFCVIISVCLMFALTSCFSKKNTTEITTSETSTTLDDQQGYISPLEEMESDTLQYPSKNSEWMYNVYNTFVEITAYIGKDDKTNIIVPGEIDTLPVKSFCAKLPRNVKSVKLPDTLVIISNLSGGWCSELEKINLPDSLIEIGEETFYGCDKLTNISIPINVEKIGIEAFRGCDLKSITIPKSVKTVDSAAFFDCRMKEVTILNPEMTFDDSNLYCETLYGYIGSTAAHYASEHSLNFKPIKE